MGCISNPIVGVYFSYIKNEYPKLTKTLKQCQLAVFQYHTFKHRIMPQAELRVFWPPRNRNKKTGFQTRLNSADAERDISPERILTSVFEKPLNSLFKTEFSSTQLG
jgi:hypothetical protein